MQTVDRLRRRSLHTHNSILAAYRFQRDTSRGSKGIVAFKRLSLHPNVLTGTSGTVEYPPRAGSTHTRSAYTEPSELSPSCPHTL